MVRKPNISQRMQLTVVMFNGQRLERVGNHKYLGMYVSFHSTHSAVNYVKNICKTRLKPLKVLANNGSGVGTPILYYGPCILSVLLDQ